GTRSAHAEVRGGALAEPETKAIAVALAAPAVVAPLPALARKRTETFLVGLPGEEMPDYAHRYHTDGSVRETVVYFYREDHRAADANPGEPVQREAVYRGKVDPYRLHAARKLSDTHLVVAGDGSLRDRRIQYHPDGRVAQTIVFYYDGDV